MDKLQGGTSWSTCLEISDDSFLESVTPGNVVEMYARNPALTDTTATTYWPLMHDSEEHKHEFFAFLDDLLDPDDSSDDDIGGDECSFSQAMRAVVTDLFADDSSDDDSDASELSLGIGESLDVRMVDLSNRKRKRDEYESGAQSEPSMQTREVKEFHGRAGYSVDRPIVVDDDAAGDGTLAGAYDCIVLSDSDPELDDDCVISESDAELGDG